MPDTAQDEVAPLDLGTSAVTLVSAAVIAAGPGATDAAVEFQMERIVSLANGRPMQRVARWSGAVHFPCVVLGATFEENTKRWLIRFATRPHPKWNPDGVEEIRCDRNDSGSPVADQIGRWAQSHVGSPAWATKVMEKAPDGTPHRVLVALKPSASVADGITVPAGTPSPRSGAAGVGVDPTVPLGRAEADSGPAPSRVAHEEPYDPMPSGPASPVPAKAGPSPEQIRDSFRKRASVTPPPTPVLADDGVPLGAPGIPGLPEGKMRADVDPTDPPLPSELSVIAQHALRLTSGSDSAEHETNAHELVEALCCYSLAQPENEKRSYSQIRSRYHAAQLLAYLRSQRSPQAVGS